MLTDLASLATHRRLRVAVTYPSRGLMLFTVAGDIDLSTADEFRTHLIEALNASESIDVVVDLSHVEFFGVVGLQALLDAQAQSLRTHSLRLVTGVRSVDRVLQVATPAETFATFRSIDAALADV